MTFDRILTVCLGNICRSPMAEGWLKFTFPSKVVESAGIHGLTNCPADSNAIEVMKDFGIDLSSHRARKLDSTLCRSFDLILVMDQSQKKEIESLFPESKGKVYLIGHFSHVSSIPDPYQKPFPIFQSCFNLIQSCLDDWKPYLMS